MIYLNYFLLIIFCMLSIGWLVAGDLVQSVYWLGAIFCTAGVTFK